MHAAIQWLLRRWGRGQELDQLNRQLETADWNRANGWCHTPSGHLMIVIRGPVEFELGSPTREYGRQPEETRKRVRIDRTFAISATEVTEFQYCQCHDLPYAPRDPASPGDHYPEQGNIHWNDAAWHCNRLTEREGLSESGKQLAYLPTYHKTGEMIRGWFGMVNCQHAPQALQRTGYRLPTEEEWEYACRAGTTTSRFFGETDLYLDSYAWSYDTAGEKAQPVGRLMPNQFGFFDMLGNVAEWCHDICRLDENGDRELSIRGGSVWRSQVRLRAAARASFSFRFTDRRMGFRIARTLPGPP